MKTKHTPGPWRVKTGTYFNNEAEGDMKLKEYTWVGVGHIGDEWPVLSKHLPENEANAQLISAAPDLVAALIQALSCIDQHEDDEVVGPIIRQAKAAIAKATGGHNE